VMLVSNVVRLSQMITSMVDNPRSNLTRYQQFPVRAPTLILNTKVQGLPLPKEV
jgi:hypothetical protein